MSKHPPTRLPAIFPLLIALTAGCADTPPLADSSETAEQIERLVEAAFHVVGSQGVPGAIVGVRQRGGPSLAAAAGVADLESRRPLRSTDPFYLGSISKTYTATVALQLADEGRLALDRPLATYLPAFPNAASITVRQLLDHTSGLADVAIWAYFRPEWDEMVHQVTREWGRQEMLDKIGELEPEFAPGAEWSYSNSNYILLAAVIEEATGRPFAAEVRARILEPLGLAATWLDRYEERRAPMPATGYLGPIPFWPHSDRFGELGPTTELDRGNLEWGDGGLVSTAADATRFLDALLGGELLSAGSLGAMQGWMETPPLGAPGEGTPADLENGYGLGLARSVRPGFEMIGHGGLYNGHTAGLWYVPECEATISFYANRGFIDARAVIDHLVATLECPHVAAPAAP